MNKRDNILLLALVFGGVIMFNFVPWRIPEKGRRFAPYFKQSENKHSLPKNILARMAYQESRFRNDIITGQFISPAGAMGIMQIIPRWHPNASPLDPEAAIEYAGKFLHRLYLKFGTWPHALAAYNWGEGNLKKWIDGDKNMPKETQNYINEIMNDIGRV